MKSAELVSDWLIGYPPATRTGYRTDIDMFAKWIEFNLEKDPIDADRADIQRWLANLADQGFAPSTVRRKASAVWSFFNYAVQEKLREHNPADNLRRPKGESAPQRGLLIEQARALISAAESHSSAAHALVWLMAGAGLRVTEACRARLEDINDVGYLSVTVKGGHTQLKPLSAPVSEAITAAADSRESGPVLMNRDGNPLSRRRAWELMERLTTSVGIESCTPHTLRHTAATLALEAGASVEDVKELLGHRSLETTLRYIENRDVLGGAAKAADRLGAVLSEEKT